MVQTVPTVLFAGRIKIELPVFSISIPPLRCLRGTAAAVTRVIPRRRRTQSRVRARPDPTVAVLSGARAGTYLLEQQGHRRILWQLSEGVSGDEAP
jgi:hypothetical protein